MALQAHITMTDEELGIGCPYTRYYVLPEVEHIQRSNVENWCAEVFVVPACVRELRDGAFQNCWNLRRIIFQSGSKLKRIGKNCLKRS